jgi:hypothetical protein
MLQAEVGMRVRCAKQSRSGVIHEGEVHWPKFSQNLQLTKSEALAVLRNLQNNKKNARKLSS